MGRRLSPALAPRPRPIAMGGGASTHNEQGNGNTAVTVVDQANSADQSQDVAQKQSVTSGCSGVAVLGARAPSRPSRAATRCGSTSAYAWGSRKGEAAANIARDYCL